MNIQGYNGVLGVYYYAQGSQIEGDGYWPIVSTLSTSLSINSEIEPTTNFHTKGQTISKIVDTPMTIGVEGEIATLKGEIEDVNDIFSHFADLVEFQNSKAEKYFELQGRGVPYYFKGFITDLPDTFGQGNATFSMTVKVTEWFGVTDPQQ